MAPKTVIEGSSISASQLKEMFDQVANGTLTGAHMQALIEHRNPFAEVRWVEFNPHTYFKTRKGLVVSDKFINSILAKQPAVMQYRGLNGEAVYNLARSMPDYEIIIELLGGMEVARKHAYTLDQIAKKINLQPNGEDGVLLNNGIANIFYLLVDDVLCAVSVRWLSGDREWSVGDLHLGEEGSWLARHRVFRNMTLAVGTFGL